MRWEEMTPSDAVENADWIGARLHPFAAYDVGAVVPTGFAAYARILHPASEWKDSHGTDVSWSQVAAWSGKTIHPLVQFHAIAAPTSGRELGPRPWSGEPREGTLSPRQVDALARLARKHTTTPDACWFCLWEGYGYTAPGVTKDWRSLSRKRVTPNPQRAYLLFTGSVGDAVGWEDGPNLWWPDERAWCVASEIDHPYSYVGGSDALIKELLADPEIEALPAKLEDGITYDTDRINEP
jgi:hypothetical protein